VEVAGGAAAPPPLVGPKSGGEALGRMGAERVGRWWWSIPPAAARHPDPGDAIERVALAGGDLDAPVAGVMTGGVVALPLWPRPSGALLLARHDLRHLVVVDEAGRCRCGVAGDLYASRR
jgi:hypothetical protein